MLVEGEPVVGTFVNYLDTRDDVLGARGPEGLIFIKAEQSTNGKPLLVVGNETSSTKAVFQINLGDSFNQAIRRPTVSERRSFIASSSLKRRR